MNWYVWDLDGTLSDCSHRVYLAQRKAWDEFHALSHEDVPYHKMTLLFRDLSRDADNQQLIVTGRNNKYRAMTIGWLTLYGIHPEALLMRPDDDFTPDGELKIRLLEEFFGGKERLLDDVIAVFEDRARVVEAMRNYGLRVLQVREGDY